MKTKVRVTCHRPNWSEHDVQDVEIRFTDDDSGIQFLRVTMTVADFYNAFVTTRGEVEGQADLLNDLRRVGARREIKKTWVPAGKVRSFIDDREGEREAALAQMNPVDIAAGWDYHHGYGNFHRYVQVGDAGGYEITLIRWVGRDGEVIQ